MQLSARLFVTSLYLSTLATPVIADDETLRTAVGAAAGAAAGAIAGDALAGREGAISGAALGGAAGAAIASSSRNPDDDPAQAEHHRKVAKTHPHTSHCPPGQAKKGRCSPR